MEWLLEAHRVMSRMIPLFALGMGAWGLFNFLRRRAPDGNYNGALVLGVGLFVLQGLVGMVLVFTGQQPSRGWVHFLYGITMVLTVPAIFAFTRGSNTARESMLYGLGMIFIWGLSERAVETALNG
jgi:heme A synthase